MLGEQLLGFEFDPERGAAIEVALHAGTLLAVVVFVWRDLLRLALSMLPTETGRQIRADEGFCLMRGLIVASIPAAVIGVLFGDQLERLFANPAIAGVGFLVTGLLLVLSGRLPRGERKAEGLSIVEALYIGVAQLIAITPGISRSGSTIFAAMSRGLSATESGRFSFLMAVPVTAGATLLKLPDILGTPSHEIGPLMLGVAAAFGSGLLALRFLVILLRRGRFSAFAWYVIPLGLVTLYVASRAP